MDEDQEICRVCRCEATVKNPLYYPCKCAGSIRFVHQNCLLEWLSHSKKKYCELCEHPFSFTPIYRQDMPTTIPTYIVIKQCLSRCGTIIKTGFRALVVAIVWLVLLPYMILWSWRFCFWSSESIGGGDLSRSMHQLSSNKHQQLSFDNSLLTPFGYNLRKFLADCFEGQVITLLIIVVLVAAYFFREWVVQNMPVEAEQESEIEQNNLETLDNDSDSNSNIRRYQQRTSIHNANNDIQPVSPLAQQKVAVDVLLTALGNMDNDDDDASNNMTTLMSGKKDIKCRLKNLQHDLQHELEHQRKQHRLSNDDMNTLYNSGNNFINDNPYLSVNYNDKDDEAEIEYMMQSIMIKNPADAFKRYSWDDLQKSGDVQQTQRRQRPSNKQSPLSKQGNRQSIQTTSFSPPPINSIFDNTETTIIGRSSTTITALEEEYDHTNTKSASFSRGQREFPRTTTRTDLYCPHQHSVYRLPTTQTTTSPTEKKHRLGSPPTNSDDDIINRPLISAQSTTVTAAMEPNQLSSLNEQRPSAAPHNLEIDDLNHAGPSQQVEQHDNNIHAHEPLEILDVNDGIMDDEDDAFDLGNDIEGVLEAIGMRGNPWILLQNSVLVCVIISLCLGVGIWIPHLTGRLIILVCPISLIEEMIYILRYVTDPITDGIIDGCFPLLWLAIKNLNQWLPGDLILFGRSFLAYSMTMIEIGTMDGYLSLLSSGLHNNGMRFSSSDIFLSRKNDTTILVHHLLLADQQRMMDVNHWLGRLMDTSHTISEKITQCWYQFAKGKSTMDRGMCIVVGYITLFMVGSWFFSYYRHQQEQEQEQECNNGDSGNKNDKLYRTTTKTATGAGIGGLILQQGIFFKVFFLIMMELVLLPMVCGILLDLATLPLIENSSITTRWDFTMTHPYCGCFLYWFVGTGFMFHFTVFIALCREIVRPGVMWFIRDSNDLHFYPVQEIMERPLLLLFRKICTGILIYLALIVLGMGSVTWAVSLFTGIFPLRLSFNKPLSTLAIDILAAQFLVPFFVAYIKPRDSSKRVLMLWWHTASRWLRLSSFMFGERYPDEEGTFAWHTVKSWLLCEKSSILVPGSLPLSLDENGAGNVNVAIKADGQLVRVPKQDYVMMDSARNMALPVYPEMLESLDPNEKYLGHPESSDENGGQEYNTTIVYVPPQFKLRIALFLALMWFFVSVLTYSITVIPLLLGRSLFDTYLAPNNPVHDLYSFGFGVCIIVSLSKSIGWISQGSECYWKRDELGGWLFLLDKTRTHLRQKLINGCKFAYLTLTIGWIIPLFVGVAIDLYVFTPFQYTNAKDQALVLHLSEDWSVGVVCLGIVYGIIYILPTNSWQGTLDRYTADGLMALNIWTLTCTILGPCILGVMCAIFIPGGLACLMMYFFDVQNVFIKLTIIRFVYPIVFGVVLVLSTLALGAKLTRLWLQSIRDDTYLIGKQLHNLEDGH